MTSLFSLQRLFSADLLITGRHWRKVVDGALSSHGVSEASAAPLVWISRLGGGVRQVTLAQSVGIERPSLVRLIDQLELQGLVVRRDDPDDRRAKGLWLTDEGQNAAACIEALLDELRARVLKRVDRQDLEAAVRVLKVLQEADPNEFGNLPAKNEATQ